MCIRMGEVRECVHVSVHACAGLRGCVLSTAHWETGLPRKPCRPVQSQTKPHLPILSQDAHLSLLAWGGEKTHIGA